MALNWTCINGTDFNCTGTNCTPCDEPPIASVSSLTIYGKIRIFIYFISFLCSCIGNFSVMLVTLKKIRNRIYVSAFTSLITHLAFVDFLLSCNVFVWVPNEINNQGSVDDIPVCRLKRYLEVAPFLAGIGTITVIAVERYIGITSNYARKWTYKRVFVSLLLIWMVTLAVYIPPVYVIAHKKVNSDCYQNWSYTASLIYGICIFIVEYACPVLIIGFCNYKILKVIKGRRNGPISQLGNAQQDKQQEEEQRKTARILMAIVVCFAIIYLPNQVFSLYLDIADKRYKQDSAWDILQLFAVLLLMHTSVNPAIYSIMDKKFRADAKALWCCCGPEDKKRSLESKSSSSGSGVTKKESLEMEDRISLKPNTRNYVQPENGD